MKPLTLAQEKYLAQAFEIQNGADGGIYFSLWVPGRTQTGRALLRRNLIEPILPTSSFPFCLSKQGMEIALQLWRDGKAKL